MIIYKIFLLLLLSSLTNCTSLLPQKLFPFREDITFEDNIGRGRKKYFSPEMIKTIQLGMTEEEVYAKYGDAIKLRFTFPKGFSLFIMKNRFIPVTKILQYSGGISDVVYGRGFKSTTNRESVDVTFFFYKDQLIDFSAKRYDFYDKYIKPSTYHEIWQEKQYRMGYKNSIYLGVGKYYAMKVAKRNKNQVSSHYFTNYIYWEDPKFWDNLGKSGYFTLKAKLDRDFEEKKGYWGEERKFGEMTYPDVKLSIGKYKHLKKENWNEELDKKLGAAVKMDALEPVLSLLGQGANPQAITNVSIRKTEYPQPVLCIAALHSSAKPETKREMLHALLEAGANPNMSCKDPFLAHIEGPILTLRYLDEVSFRLLLEYGADVHLKSSNGRTSILNASEERYSYPKVKLLLDKKVNPHLADNEGNSPANSPFLAAADVGDLVNCKLLLSSGININEKNWQGRTALHFAIDNLDLEMIRFLLKNGADVNSKDKNGSTPFMLASYTSDAIPEIFYSLLEYKPDIKAQDKSGRNSLHYAVLYDNLLYVEELLKQGVNINLPDNKGFTAFHLAVTLRESSKMVKLLHANGADTNAKSISGITPLMLAVNFCRMESDCKFLVLSLLNTGANYKATDKYGLTATRYANHHSYTILFDNKATDFFKKAVDGLDQTPTDDDLKRKKSKQILNPDFLELKAELKKDGVGR